MEDVVFSAYFLPFCPLGMTVILVYVHKLRVLSRTRQP